MLPEISPKVLRLHTEAVQVVAACAAVNLLQSAPSTSHSKYSLLTSDLLSIYKLTNEFTFEVQCTVDPTGLEPATS